MADPQQPPPADEQDDELHSFAWEFGDLDDE